MSDESSVSESSVPESDDPTVDFFVLVKDSEISAADWEYHIEDLSGFLEDREIEWSGDAEGIVLHLDNGDLPVLQGQCILIRRSGLVETGPMPSEEEILAAATMATDGLVALVESTLPHLTHEESLEIVVELLLGDESDALLEQVIHTKAAIAYANRVIKH